MTGWGIFYRLFLSILGALSFALLALETASG